MSELDICREEFEKDRPMDKFYYDEERDYYLTEDNGKVITVPIYTAYWRTFRAGWLKSKEYFEKLPENSESPFKNS